MPAVRSWGTSPASSILWRAGLSDAEIAAGFHLSEATVKSHVARVRAELGVRDRVQAAVFCYENGIVRPGRPGRRDRG